MIKLKWFKNGFVTSNEFNRKMENSDQIAAKDKLVRKRNILSSVGLIFGFLSIFTASLGIAPILAVVFSSIGLSKVRDTGRGKVQSWTGLILGFLYFLVFLYHQGYLGLHP